MESLFIISHVFPLSLSLLPFNLPPSPPSKSCALYCMSLIYKQFFIAWILGCRQKFPSMVFASSLWDMYIYFLSFLWNFTIVFHSSIMDRQTFLRMLCVTIIFLLSYASSVAFIWWIMCWWAQQQMFSTVQALFCLPFRMQCRWWNRCQVFSINIVHVEFYPQ